MLVRRESKTGANDLHTVYRPCMVNEVLGNKTHINVIRQGLDTGTLQHAMLFTGDAGCGKTTLARIIALGLNCKESSDSTSKPCLECTSCKSILDACSMDVQEINVGSAGGKDAVDTIAKDLPSAPFGSRYKVVIFDEAHSLTSAAQNLLLKVIETGYKHVYFVFCTNQPEKLSEPFLTRCTIMNFIRLNKDMISSMLKEVFDTEILVGNIVFQDGTNYAAVLNHIATECRGVPRTALVWLNHIIKEGSWSLDVVKEVTDTLYGEDNPQIINISRSLFKGSFKEAVTIYDKLKEKTPTESVRIGVTAYFIGCLKRAKTFEEAKVFSEIVDIMTQNFYIQGVIGEQLLYNCMFKVTCIMRGKK